MAGNIKGITIEFKGETTKLEQAIRKVNSSTKEIDSSLKKVNNALKFNPTNVELWRQKQTLLKAKIDETTRSLDELKNIQKQLDDSGVSKESAEYQELRRNIIETESKLKTFKAQLREVGNANLKALEQQFKRIGDKATQIGQTMTTKVTVPIVAGYTAAAKYASDYEENLNKIDVAFGENSKSVKDWANTARDEFGLSKVQATESVSAFGALGKGIGLTEKQAADMSTTLAGLSADLGSYFNVSTEDSAKALEGIFTGESEALKKFGVVMTDTNLEKFAADQGLVWKELSQTDKTMLRYQYVLAKTKDAQGDFARTSNGTANSTKIFKSAVQDLATSIGTNLLPIITPVIQKVTEWINKFNELSPETQKIITIVGLLVAAIGPVLIIVGKVATGISSIISLVNLVGGATTALSLGPMVGIVAAIAAVVAAGIWLYKNWDNVKAAAQALGDKLKNVWDTIKNVTVTAWNNVKNAITTPFTNAKNTISHLIDTVKSKITGAWDAIKTKTANAWNSIVDKMLSPFRWAKDVIAWVIDVIRSWFPIRLGNLFRGIKLPHFEIEWSTITFGDYEIDYPSGFDIEWYKKGGIFDKASLIGVGEAGPEAVVPLDKFWDKLDNIAAASSGEQITINVYASDGMNVNELALKVEQRLVQLQKQRAKAYGTI